MISGKICKTFETVDGIHWKKCVFFREIFTKFQDRSNIFNSFMSSKDGGVVNRGNGSETDKEANKQAKIYVCIRCSMLINYA